MGAPAQQQIIADPLASEWYGAPLVWGLSLVDFGVFFAIGIVVSACVWFVVESLKIRGKLLTPPQRELAPIAICLCIAPWLVPLTIRGLQGATSSPLPLWAAVLIGIGLGVVGGFGARGAHQKAEQLMQAVFGWALDKLRTSSSGGDGGS